MNIDKMNVNSQMTDVIQQSNNKAQENLEQIKKDEQIKDSPAAIYEKGTQNKDVGTIYNKDMVQKLKDETANNKLKLIKIVEDSISRQGKSFQIFNSAELLKLDAEGKKEAKALIAEDGDLGVEKTSQRLVDFAKAISNGDTSKSELLRDAIDKGFKEAERMFGGELPEISQDTYNRTMELFDEWVAGDVSETKDTENL